MPALVVAAAVAGVAAGTTIAAGVITLGFSITAAAATLVVGAASQLLAKKQKPASALGSAFDQSRSLTVRQPIAPREVVYGRVVKGGTLVFAHTTPATALRLFSEQAVVPTAPPYTVTVREAAGWQSTTQVQIVTFDSSVGEGGDYVFAPIPGVPGSPNAAQYAAAAGVYTFNQADAGKTVEISYHASVVTVADNVMHLIIALAGHEVQQLGAVYFDGELVPLTGNEAAGRWAGFVNVRKYTGTATQTVDSVIAAAAPSLWTASHRLRGIAYLAVRLIGNGALFPNGIPNISCEVYGKKVYDPRTASTHWSDNAALCIADYLTDARLGLGADYATEIDEAALIDAANVCDEAVALAAGGTERRYTCNGVVDTADQHESVVAAMATAMSTQARVVYTGGRWTILPGAYRAPVVALDEDDARGPIKVQPALGRADAFNAVKGVYVAEANSWQPADFPQVTNSTYEAQDNGERLWADIELPFTTSAPTAQRIARLHLEAARQEIRVVYPAGLEAMKLRAGDTVELTNSRLGWSAKPFEVERWAFALREDASAAPILGVDLDLKETASGVYTWSSSDETTVDVAPNTNLPNPLIVRQPGAPEVSEELFEGRNGVVARAIVTWPAAPDQLVTEYELQYRALTTQVWTAAPRVRAESALRVVTEALAPGVHDFRVRAFNALGIASPWSQTRREIVGLAAPPADVTGLTLQAVSALAVLQWQRHPDLDVRIGGRIHVRHTEDVSTPTWSASYSVIDPLPGDSTVAVVPLKAGTYLLRAQDSTGQFSVNVTTVDTRQGSVLAFSPVGSVTEDPTFGGAKTDVAVSAGKLSLSGTGLWDVIPDLDAEADVDLAGGQALEGLYEFAAGIDLGTMSNCQLNLALEVQVVNMLDRIDSRPETIDSWEVFDGDGAGAVGDVIVEARETDDDPSGSPTWSAWRRLITADYSARAFQFRARLSVDDPAYNIQVSKLRVSAKEVV